MGMLGNKSSSVNDVDLARNDTQALGRQEQMIEESIDDDLPSVNRRRGRSKFIDVVGFGSILGLGLAMMYFINSDNTPKVEAPKKVGIVDALPPLDIPKPARPEPLATVEPVPIPMQKQIQSTSRPAEPSWSDRKMNGLPVIGNGGSEGAVQSVGQVGVGQQVADRPDVPTQLALKLKSTTAQGVSAGMLPDRNYLITKGTTLDCALETAVDSTVPGLTTCRLTRDVYSDNGHVVLLDRGSQLVGEYQGGLTAGQARIFMLWTRAKTPNGVIVALDSPGTDALGRSGHSGWVDTHFMQRFGAAIMMSLIKDSLAYVRSKQEGAAVVVSGQQNTDQLATEILKNTVAIPPTLYINQGEHIQIMVARDLDFSTVYGLKLKE